MPDRETDASRGKRVEGREEYRGARVQGGEHPPGSEQPAGADVASTDDAMVASEPMSAEATLSRLAEPGPARIPPGKQLSGEPPAR